MNIATHPNSPTIGYKLQSLRLSAVSFIWRGLVNTSAIVLIRRVLTTKRLIIKDCESTMVLNKRRRKRASTPLHNTPTNSFLSESIVLPIIPIPPAMPPAPLFASKTSQGAAAVVAGDASKPTTTMTTATTDEPMVPTTLKCGIDRYHRKQHFHAAVHHNNHALLW